MYAGRLKRHKIELAHAPEAEKVYVRLNGIPLYETTMLKTENSKTFQFFVDDELCVITIEKKGNQYAYRFTSPEYSTSRLARLRKWKDRLLLAGIAAVFALVVGGLGVPFVYNYFHTRQLNNNLNMGGIITPAYLTQPPDIAALLTQGITVQYKFRAGLRTITSQTVIPAADSSLLALNSLFPVTGKSVLTVLYSGTDPHVNRLLTDQLPEKQTETYRQQARKACMQHSFTYLPPATGKSLFCDCLLTYLYTHYQLQGFARLCHANTPKADNSIYNVATFEAFMQQDLNREITNICTRNAAGGRE
ncbi:hypothetical protein C7N43_24030 [Sphingobacteriales bacterium UPWRP_1]|nr:hypothetical protein BVG80_12790 [Sphingobacteriales bacterium TSM_CSM]PSJ74424.1 hypothetical protein C7N43_24030 [Sphingobacteriales bacterium UPWRP_1]